MTTSNLMSKALASAGEGGEPVPAEVIHDLVDLDGVDGPLTITQVAELLDVSPHTLRYYERAGLITVGRDSAGQRSYDIAAVRRLVFLTRMRLSGMAMRDLQHYVRLVDQGEETVPERLDLLMEHRDTIRRQIRELTLSLAATEYKIATYGGRTGDDCSLPEGR